MPKALVTPRFRTSFPTFLRVESRYVSSLDSRGAVGRGPETLDKTRLEEGRMREALEAMKSRGIMADE